MQPPAKLHPWPVRVMHWINAGAMLIMIGSGWGIYNDSVILHFLYFPRMIILGSWASNSAYWHFAGMWLLAINGAAYLTYGFGTGRFRKRLLPIRVSDVIRTVRDTLHLRIEHNDITEYNAVQKALYILAILAGTSQVITGLALWKPVQFSWLVAPFGNFQGVRIAHFTGMAVLVGFLVVHVALALLVPQTLWAMLTGGPRLRTQALPAGEPG